MSVNPLVSVTGFTLLQSRNTDYSRMIGHREFWEKALGTWCGCDAASRWSCWGRAAIFTPDTFLPFSAFLPSFSDRRLIQAALRSGRLPSVGVSGFRPVCSSSCFRKQKKTKRVDFKNLDRSDPPDDSFKIKHIIINPFIAFTHLQLWSMTLSS